jgi:hypothetical protein
MPLRRRPPGYSQVSLDTPPLVQLWLLRILVPLETVAVTRIWSSLNSLIV